MTQLIAPVAFLIAPTIVAISSTMAPSTSTLTTLAVMADSPPVA